MKDGVITHKPFLYLFEWLTEDGDFTDFYYLILK